MTSLRSTSPRQRNRCKLSPSDVQAMREAYHDNASVRELAKRYGVGTTTVDYWCRRVSHLPAEWTGSTVEEVPMNPS